MKEKNKIILSAWNRLAKIQQLVCHAKSIELNRSGKAAVSITKEGNNVFVFHEKGSWSGKQKIDFSNKLRWTLDLSAGAISLEHLRYGSAVFLVNLVPFNDHVLTSLHAHVCKSDTYTGKMHLTDAHIHLHWQVTGPKKNEQLDSYYF
ncbi:MAG: DUF6314 family protein [Candidatus Rhabdochlamydia sp.]